MENCLNCRYGKNMPHGMIGCEKKKTIVIAPESEKDCFESNIEFMKFFDEVINSANPRR